MRARIFILGLVALGAFAQSEPDREMLDAHNRVRARAGVPRLVWSGKLAAYAQNWADTLVRRRQFGHSGGDRYGENLFAISGGRATATQVVQEWTAEARDYDRRSNSCRSTCGHYTQIVWRDTRAVGCGVARGGGREVWVCSYDPPGNYVGQRPY